VEASSAISELSQNAIYRLLPSSIRVCIRAHFILRRWLILKIAAPRLGVHLRQERINLLLQAIEVARLRSADTGPSASLITEQSCIRSFVETVLTSAVLSLESRLFTRAWQNVAGLRGTHYDTLVSLLAKPFTRSLPSKRAVTFDVGWIIERILELISLPDIVNSQLVDSRPLINFDKRRYAYHSSKVYTADVLADISSRSWPRPSLHNVLDTSHRTPRISTA
jgi:GTPase-activating protein BEM2